MPSASSTDVLRHPGSPATVPSAPAAGAAFRDVYAYQQQDMWCWAACAHMALKQLGMNPLLDQCAIAGIRFGRDCCGDPPSCNQPCPLGEIDDLYRRLAVKCRTVEGPVPETRLMESVLKDQPVQLNYTYGTSPITHVVLVIGETNRHGMKYLRVADPREKDGMQLLLFEDVRTDSGKGSWTRTWIDMEKANA